MSVHTDHWDPPSPHTLVRPSFIVPVSLHGQGDNPYGSHLGMGPDHDCQDSFPENPQELIHSDCVRTSPYSTADTTPIGSFVSVADICHSHHFTELFDSISRFVDCDPSALSNKLIFDKTSVIFHTLMAIIPSDDTSLVLNLSSYSLSPAEQSTLQRGLKFCPTPGEPAWGP